MAKKAKINGVNIPYEMPIAFVDYGRGLSKWILVIPEASGVPDEQVFDMVDEVMDSIREDWDVFRDRAGISVYNNSWKGNHINGFDEFLKLAKATKGHIYLCSSKFKTIDLW